MVRKLALATVASGVVLGVAAESSTYLSGSADRAAGDLAVGLAFTVGAALVLRRSSPVAALLAATGSTWFLGSLVGPLVFLHRGPLVHLLLSYPRGRLGSRFERAVVAAAYAVALVCPLGRSVAVTGGLASVVLAAAVSRHAHSVGLERRARATALACTAALAAVLAGGGRSPDCWTQAQRLRGCGPTRSP